MTSMKYIYVKKGGKDTNSNLPTKESTMVNAFFTSFEASATESLFSADS